MCHINPIISWGASQWRLLLRKCAAVTSHIFLHCLHNCFLGAVWLSQAHGGSPACRQAARTGWGHAGSCRASEVCWLALNYSCWRWKSIRLYPSSLSFSLPLEMSLSMCVSLSLSPPAAPSAAHLRCHMNLSCPQVERQRRHWEETGEGV